MAMQTFARQKGLPAKKGREWACRWRRNVASPKSDSKVMKHRQLKEGIIQPGINDSNENK
jgi:hypothetical protein